MKVTRSPNPPEGEVVARSAAGGVTAPKNLVLAATPRTPPRPPALAVAGFGGFECGGQPARMWQLLQSVPTGWTCRHIFGDDRLTFVPVSVT